MRNYQLTVCEGIELFVHNAVSEVAIKDEPRIELERTLFGRKFVVYGFALEEHR